MSKCLNCLLFLKFKGQGSLVQAEGFIWARSSCV